MNLKTKYKHIEFTEIHNPGRKTSKWEIHNHQTDEYLGRVEWDRGWRQYVSIVDDADSFSYLKFARSCHDDISNFLGQLMDARKK